MKKISLGSFPLINVTGKDRRIFESYMIKVISDLITSNQISNTIYTDRVQYITPLSILKFIKEDQKDVGEKQRVPGFTDQADIRNQKAETIKHAFKNTKTLYQSIAADPFYRNNMFYPIYIEEAVKTTYGYNDYNYDFLILANDLIKQQIVDEIIFDDKATLLFLVLKCLLMPNLQVNEIGLAKNNGENFRKYFAVFLETCKNENVNPFDMFIKLIKAAGKQKRNNVTGALTTFTNRLIANTPNKAQELYHSKSFVNLFNTKGEIKDASFLLNEPLKNINKFLADDGKGIADDYNPILRQYSQAKTHEYARILSVVDALAAFNKSNNVVNELNSNTIHKTIDVGNGETLTINTDSIISEFETVYFRRFLEDIVILENRAITNVRNKLLSEFKQDLLRANIVTKESLTTDIAKNENEFIKVSRELKDWKDKAINLVKVLGLNNFEDIATQRPDIASTPTYASIVNNTANYNNEYNRLMQTLSIQNSQLSTAPSQSGIEKTFQDKALSLQVNLEIFQAQLTALYSEIYQYIYSESFQQHIVTMKSGAITAQRIDTEIIGSKDANINSLKMTVAQIVDMFKQEIEVNIKNEIASSFIDPNKALKSTKIKAAIQDTITEDAFKDIIIKNIFIPIFTKYTNSAISSSNQIKDIKSENNPVLKRILSNKDLFKAYLLTSETLISAYELLHYIDTLKYEEGIINHPVSKVSNPINKMDFMIKRLGLSDNPVFIFHEDKAGANILLSMPAHLSLTGQNFISQVKMQEFVQFGQINWSKDLWDHNMMFGGPGNSKKFKDLSKSIEIIKKEITEKSKLIIDAKSKEGIKKQAEINAKKILLAKKEEEFRAMQQSANGNNFTSNMQASKRPETPSNYQMQYRPGGRYNTGMDQQGYYPHERDIMNNARDGMNHLQQQTVPPQPRQDQYPSSNQYPPEVPHLNPPGYGQQFRDNLNHSLAQDNQEVPRIHQFEPQEQNNFMNNPYIQNRTNLLNQFQN